MDANQSWMQIKSIMDANQSINQSISQSVSQSASQSVSQSVNQSLNQSISQSIDKPIASQTANRSIDRPYQPKSQPANRVCSQRPCWRSKQLKIFAWKWNLFPKGISLYCVTPPTWPLRTHSINNRKFWQRKQNYVVLCPSFHARFLHSDSLSSLINMVYTFDSLDEILRCHYSQKSFWTVFLSCGAVFCTKFEVFPAVFSAVNRLNTWCRWALMHCITCGATGFLLFGNGRANWSTNRGNRQRGWVWSANNTCESYYNKYTTSDLVLKT